MTFYYSNDAQPTTLAASVNGSSTALTLTAVSGFPTQFPFRLVVDGGGPNAEVVNVTGLTGSTVTVTRGADGTASVSHATGVSVVHVHTAGDFENIWDHINNTSAHGAHGDVVGEDNEQTLTKKTMLAYDPSHVALVVKGAPGQTANVLRVVNDANDPLLQVDEFGETTTNSLVTDIAEINPDNGTDVALTINQHASSDEDLIDVLDDSANPLFVVDKTGAALSPTTTGGADRTVAPFARLTLSSNQTVAYSATATVEFDTNDPLTTDDDMVNTSLHRVVCTVAGTHMISSALGWANNGGDDDGRRRMWITVNGDQVVGTRTDGPTGPVATLDQNIAIVHRLDVGDEVQVQVIQGSGDDLDIDVAGCDFPVFLSVGWLAP